MNNGSINYDKLLSMWRDEKKKRQEAEGELTIIRGIGMNSPEMKKFQNRVKELENSLSIALETNNQYQKDMALVREDAQVEYLRRDLRIKELEQINKEHQDLNGKLQVELNRYKGSI